MENKHYKNYFLGQMSADDVEKLELRVISTNDSEVELLSAEDNLIEDYLDGKLTKEETQAFDTNFLVTEERRKRVEFVQMMRGFAENTATKSGIINENKPSFFNQLKSIFNPRKFAFGFGGVVLILTIGFVIYTSLNNYANGSEISVLLNKSFKNDRPTESRISGFDYAPKIEGTRGNNDKTQDLNFVSAKSRATEAVLKNETAENLHAFGRVYLAERNFDEAIKQFEKALKKNPNIAQLHNDLGVALMERAKQKEEGKLELFAKANEEIEKSIELDSNLVEAYFNRGLVIESLNLPNQAKEAWENYLKLDSSSNWANEAREHLQKLETNKPVSKTKEEILRDFLQAKQTNDAEKAWQTLSRNREMITGKLIPQQLAFLFVDSKTNGDEAKAKEALDALVYVGKLEEEKSGDLYWSDLATYYSNVPDNKISMLKRAQDSMRKGYELCLNNKYKEAGREFRNAEDSFRKSRNTWEEYFAKYWISYFLFLNNEISKSNDLLNETANFSQARNYKWLSSQAFGWLAVNANSSNKLSKSIEYDKKAIKYSEDVSELYNLQKILSQTADHYQQLGQYTKALDYAEKGLHLGNLPESSLRQKWRDYDAVSDIFKTIKFYKTSEIYKKETLKLSLEQLDDKVFKWMSYTSLAVIYAIQSRYDEAFDLLNESRKTVESFEDADGNRKRLAYIDLQTANLYTLQKNCNAALASYDKALGFYESAEYQVEQFEARKGKLNCYLTNKNDLAFEQELPVVLDIFNKYRSEILEEQNRNSFFDNEQSVYDIVIDYEFGKSNYAKAFDYSEESRSRSLLDLQNSIVEVSKEEEQPDIKFSSNVFEPLRLARIQAEMSENVQLLEYTVLNDKVLIWLITKDKLSVNKTDVSLNNLQEKVSTYLDLISKNIEPEEQRRLAIELYQILINPIKDELDSNKNICIIPDKILLVLPFAALFSDKYLIEEYQIFYAPSANVFLNSSKKAKEFGAETSETLLSIGNPTFNQNVFENLPQLPSAKQEALEIAKFYNDSIVITEKEATKERVKENLKKADVIHFAGHYVVDEHLPLLSSLILAGDKKEDSSLANYEIIGENLSQTRLIVLSACQTSVERYYNGEGMISASRTFLATGVPLVVASQWEVDSEAAAKLMTDLHGYRKSEKLSTVEAMRRSQLEMLRSEKFQQPYYWAAFIALGGYTQF